MKSKLIHDADEKTYVLIFEIGDEVVGGLLAFAKEKQLSASHFTAIGAFESVTFGFFERERKDYKKITIDEEVEVMSLIGNIALLDDEPRVHAHVVVGKKDGTAHGGHLLEAIVRPTLELFLIESSAELHRRMNTDVGLPLIDLRN